MKTQELRKCLNCSVSFVVPSNNKTKRFCNHSCGASFANSQRGNGPPKFTCLSCGKKNTNFYYGNKKYCNSKCFGNHKRFLVFEQIRSGNLDNVGWDSIRRFVIENRERKCEECNVGEVYNSKPLTLQIDHIDGNSDNNNLDNLKILCPNCHSQTSTWCARNVKNTKRSKHARLWRKEVQASLAQQK